MKLYNNVVINFEKLLARRTRICIKKFLKSPQWLRNLKFKKYPFWRIDKRKNLQIIDEGGWHFAYLQDVKNISQKIKSFAHGEFNQEEIVNEKNIELRINRGEDVLGRGYKIKKIEIDSSYPEYIINNKDKLKNWIA